MKGTFSEVERYQIRARMVRGRLHKAERGALALRLPVGYERELGTGAIRLTPDEGVRHAIERTFALFAQLGSVRGVLRYLRDAGLQLPHRVVRRGLGASVEWQPPSYDAFYQVLTNPLYAGVYCFGKRRQRVDPLTHARHRERVERAAWAVYLPDHHPGYLTPERRARGAPCCRASPTAASAPPSAAGPAPAAWTGWWRSWCSGSWARAAWSWPWRRTSSCGRSRPSASGNGGSSSSAWSAMPA